MLLSMPRALAFPMSLVLLFALLPSSHAGSQARSTERITLVVEILEREDRPTIPCGILGAQPRDVTAHVVSVEEGTFEGDRVLLSWPVCSLDSLTVGQRYRIQIRRFVDRPVTPEMRYRVRRATAP